MAKFHCHFSQCKFIPSITSASREFMLPCVICQLFSKIEENYWRVFTFILCGLDLNEHTLAFNGGWNPELCTAKSCAGMMYSIQIKSFKCFLFKNLNIFFLFWIFFFFFSYFSNALNNLMTFGLNKNLHDMYSLLLFETLLRKIMSLQMKKKVSLVTDGVYNFNHKTFVSSETMTGQKLVWSFVLIWFIFCKIVQILSVWPCYAARKILFWERNEEDGGSKESTYCLAYG